MTPDLSNKTVEEIVKDGKDRMGSFGYWRRAANELARRLEEAQQKIVAQQAELVRLGYVGSDIPMTALAANNAKVAAEALKEGSEKCHEMYLYTGYDCANALGNMAAEYRAKATEAGRKE